MATVQQQIFDGGGLTPTRNDTYRRLVEGREYNPSLIPTRQLSQQPAPAPTPTRTPTGGGGATGPTPTPARPTPQPVSDPGPTRAEQEAERRAQEAEEARRRQLDEMRRAIENLPLDPALIAQFAERSRLADRGLSEARAFGQRARSQSDVDFDQFVRQLQQQTGQAIGGLRQEAAARNLAFQPAFVGVGMRDIRDSAMEAQTLAEQQRAVFLSGIERQIQEAQAAREAEQAAIARERARAEADHRAFIDQQLAALGQ